MKAASDAAGHQQREPAASLEVPPASSPFTNGPILDHRPVKTGRRCFLQATFARAAVLTFARSSSAVITCAVEKSRIVSVA